MGAPVVDAAAPGLDGASIRIAIQAAARAVSARTAESAEQVNAVDVGTSIRRIDIAVIYPQTDLFHSSALGRHANGWTIDDLRVDGNLNDILNAPWPG